MRKTYIDILYQSHQSGIETMVSRWKRRLVNTTNRTNLELKLSSWIALIATDTLPIAPIWNWNFETRHHPDIPGILPIAPIWNWNRVRFRPSMKPHLTTNRTNLELKRIYSVYSMVGHNYQSHQSGIETRNVSVWCIFGICYQSHQSGIETTWKGKKGEGSEGYQSHQSGIETWHYDCRGRESPLYQSHQSGIETSMRNPKRSWTHTTNRTNLELKLLICRRWRWDLTTTNRTNLELKHHRKHHRERRRHTTNRTNLELKLPIAKVPLPPNVSTNRTNLELKHVYAFSLRQFSPTTNRTNLELKLMIYLKNREKTKLPIAPIWNWNTGHT